MAAKCAREECGKTVYPIEELKCLDKVWHKGCFKCTACGMTLSMKTYKGYEKKPYCEAHYPKTVPSAVIDTPEMERVRINTKNQSAVQYHEQFEKMRGTKIEVADDPEMKRLLDNTKVQSLAHYHGEHQKKVDQDAHRSGGESPNPAAAAAAAFFATAATANIQPTPAYEPSHKVYNSNSMESISTHSSSQPSNTTHLHLNYQQINNGNENSNTNGNPAASFNVYGLLAAVDAKKKNKENDGISPYTQRLMQQTHGTIVYSTEMGGRVSPTEKKPVGSIADYDPMSAEQPTKQINASGPTGGGKAPGGKAATGGFTVKALYDYTAADKDEVSFKEGDVIVNCQKVDDGWLTGTVQKTLLWGMLPANYVEKINTPTGMFRVK
uniref:LIM and SH3 domain protein F42H10.3 n=1 Tax=Meloidogyne incognita TaxID=6306 RepID=A0A914L2S3_MELIC